MDIDDLELMGQELEALIVELDEQIKAAANDAIKEHLVTQRKKTEARIEVINMLLDDDKVIDREYLTQFDIQRHMQVRLEDFQGLALAAYSDKSEKSI